MSDTPSSGNVAAWVSAVAGLIAIIAAVIAMFPDNVHNLACKHLGMPCKPEPHISLLVIDQSDELPSGTRTVGDMINGIGPDVAKDAWPSFSAEISHKGSRIRALLQGSGDSDCVNLADVRSLVDSDASQRIIRSPPYFWRFSSPAERSTSDSYSFRTSAVKNGTREHWTRPSLIFQFSMKHEQHAVDLPLSLSLKVFSSEVLLEQYSHQYSIRMKAGTAVTQFRCGLPTLEGGEYDSQFETEGQLGDKNMPQHMHLSVE